MLPCSKVNYSKTFKLKQNIIFETCKIWRHRMRFIRFWLRTTIFRRFSATWFILYSFSTHVSPFSRSIYLYIYSYLLILISFRFVCCLFLVCIAVALRHLKLYSKINTISEYRYSKTISFIVFWFDSNSLFILFF